MDNKAITMDDGEQYSCLACGGTFQNQTILIEHMLHVHTAKKPKEGESEVHDNNGDNTGRHLSVDQSSLNSDESHNQETEDVRETLTCNVCDEELPNLEFCLSHSLQHADASKCLVCGNNIKGTMKLKNHILNHMVGMKFPCIICSEEFIFQSDLRRHAWNKHSQANSCGLCGGIFNDRELLKEHFETRHDIERTPKLQNESDSLKTSEEHDQREEAPASSHDYDDGTFSVDDDTRQSDLNRRDVTNVAVNVQSSAECSLCSKTFKGSKSLIRHLREIHDDNCEKFECICGQTFKRERTMISHKERFGHYEEDRVLEEKAIQDKFSEGLSTLFQCELCNKHFTTAVSLGRHRREHHYGQKKFKCECGHQFARRSHLDLHRSRSNHLSFSRVTNSRTETTAGEVRGPIAEAMVSDVDGTLKSRLVVNSSLQVTEKFQARIVNEDETGVNKNDTTVHSAKADKIQDDDSMTQCHICGEFFDNDSNAWTIHQRNHVENLHYNCNECEKRFLTESALQRHLEMHNSSNPYQCDTCFEILNTLQELKAHNQTMHRNLDKRQFPCEVCGKFCPSRQALYAHRKLHNKVKTHVCGLCGRAFHFATTLKRHEEEVHTKVKKFQCEHCTRSFSRKHHLESHVSSIHAKLRAFSCSECDLGFSTKHARAGHMERKHGVTLRRRLRYCDKAPMDRKATVPTVQLLDPGTDLLFVNSNDEETQTAVVQIVDDSQIDEVHDIAEVTGDGTGEVLYQCGECLEIFQHLQTLERHIDDVHTKRQYCCDVCGKVYSRRNRLLAHVEKTGHHHAASH